jgi:tRNA(fMet)-specific endonuclease VapC
MIVLDTDHVSELQEPDSARGQRLSKRLDGVGDVRIATTMITYEEQMRGWLAAIHKLQPGERQVSAYDALAELLEFYKRADLVRFDRLAAEQFQRLRTQKIRIGTMDLKIASIALIYGATLPSANLKDFRQVPGLTVEDWMS